MLTQRTTRENCAPWNITVLGRARWDLTWRWPGVRSGRPVRWNLPHGRVAVHVRTSPVLVISRTATGHNFSVSEGRAPRTNWSRTRTGRNAPTCKGVIAVNRSQWLARFSIPVIQTEFHCPRWSPIVFCSHRDEPLQAVGVCEAIAPTAIALAYVVVLVLYVGCLRAWVESLVLLASLPSHFAGSPLASLLADPPFFLAGPIPFPPRIPSQASFLGGVPSGHLLKCGLVHVSPGLSNRHRSFASIIWQSWLDRGALFWLLRSWFAPACIPIVCWAL